MSRHAWSLLSHLHRLAAPAAPDAVLLQRWTQQRDQNAFAVLMARHGPIVLGICRRLLGDVPEAEEVFQAVFVLLSRQAGQLRRPESLAGFLHTVAVRLARKTAKAKRRRQRIKPHR
jgi:DNA-directed RNA polymerase specialized sigma24 family protein